jgi:ornithine carbamoyltransferase
VYELTKEILSEWVRRELYTLFYSTPDDLFYIPEIIKWKKKKNTTKKAMIEQNANTDSQSKAADNVYSKLFAD